MAATTATNATAPQAGPLTGAARFEEVKLVQGSHARDYGGALCMALIVILYHVTDEALRTDSQIGLAFRNVYLRRALWVLLAGAVIAMIGGFLTRLRTDRGAQTQNGLVNGLRLLSIVIPVAFVVNAGLFVFFGAALTTVAPLTVILAVASLIAIVVLAEPWTRRRLWARTLRQIAPAAVIAVGVLIAWEVLINVFQVRQFLLPKPSVIGQNLLDSYPDLVSKTWVTVQNALWGYAIGCSLGALVGIASARFAAFSRAILPFAIAVNSTPLIAFAPIMGFWFGVTKPESKIAVVAIMVFFPVMINMVRGLLSADQNALELMRSLASSELTTFGKVRFPSALPYLFNGLKFGTTWSVIGAVVAEFFGGTTLGIGFYIKNKPTEFNFPAAWAAIVVVSIVGILFYMIVSLVERVLMPWHVAFREQSR